MVKANRISQPQATARRGWAHEEVCRRGEGRPIARGDRRGDNAGGLSRWR